MQRGVHAGLSLLLATLRRGELGERCWGDWSCRTRGPFWTGVLAGLEKTNPITPLLTARLGVSFQPCCRTSAPRLPSAPATMLLRNLQAWPFLLSPSPQGPPWSQPDRLPEAPHLLLPLLSLHRPFTSESVTLCMRMGPGVYLNPILPPQSEPTNPPRQSSPGHQLGLPHSKGCRPGTPPTLHSAEWRPVL